MVHATFSARYVTPYGTRFECKETGDVYHIIEMPNGTYQCCVNGSPQVRRSNRAEAVTWVEQEARLQVASLISHNA